MEDGRRRAGDAAVPLDALLLPDGRVLSSGGGICGTCDCVGYLAKDAQVFTPPYLFKTDGSGDLAPRPAIASAPGSVAYGAGFQIDTPDGGSIQYVSGPTANPVDAWTHVALTYDGSNLRLYVDGTQAVTRAAGGAIQATTTHSGSAATNPTESTSKGSSTRPASTTARSRKPTSKPT